jgi:hypothetical protein
MGDPDDRIATMLTKSRVTLATREGEDPVDLAIVAPELPKTIQALLAQWDIVLSLRSGGSADSAWDPVTTAI